MQREANLYDDLVHELETLKENTRTYVRMLPAPEVATKERLLELVQEECERAQIVVKRITHKDAKLRKGSKSPAREIGVKLELTGSFSGFLRRIVSSSSSGRRS